MVLTLPISVILRNAKNFVKACLTRNAADRPTAQELLQKNKWLQVQDESGADERELKLKESGNSIMPTRMLVSFQMFSQANPLKRVALNALAKNYSLDPTYQRFFATLDTSFTGTLSLLEFTNGFDCSGCSEEEIYNMFHKLDFNEKNEVQFTEWIAATPECEGELTEEQIQEAFDLMDEDHSGIISKKNLVKLLGGTARAQLRMRPPRKSQPLPFWPVATAKMAWITKRLLKCLSTPSVPIMRVAETWKLLWKQVSTNLK